MHLEAMHPAARPRALEAMHLEAMHPSPPHHLIESTLPASHHLASPHTKLPSVLVGGSVINYAQIPNANCVSGRHAHNMEHGYVLDLEGCGRKCDEHPHCTGFLHDKGAEPNQASCFLQKKTEHLDMYAKQHQLKPHFTFRMA